MAIATTPAIEPVAADDRAAMDAWFALQQRCHAHDTPELPPPCPVRHAHWFTRPGYVQRAWTVREGAGVVAAAGLSLPVHDNVHHGYAGVLVAPSHRRHGLGARLLAHVVGQARDAGRTQLAMGSGARPDAPDPGSAFLRASGARLALVEKRRRLVLPPPEHVRQVDAARRGLVGGTAEPARLRDLGETARRASPAYRLVQWAGPTPPEWLDDLAPLVGRMSTDAPQGELSLEPERWDADRLRERDEAAAAAGVRSVVTAARGPDGRLVAFTEAGTCVVQDGFAHQGDTLVHPAHRGRRLGLRIKLANLELLVREHPEVRAIDTFNADANRWMIAVNEAMGFVPIRHVADWELDL